MSNPRSCPDCNSSRFELDRRQFVRATAVGAVAASTGIFIRPISAEEPAAKKPETLVAQLYKSLNEQQRAAVCFGFDHPLRQEVDNNWHITKTRVADFTADQQDLIREIFKGLHDPEYAQQVMQQVEHDNGRRPDVPKSGFGSCAIAMFGEPGTGKFEFVFTGRHVTRRCDGDSIEGAAFGGPIFYGHAAKSFNEPADHAGNIYWYQAKRANELFQALDGKQRDVALRTDARDEAGTKTVKLSGKSSELAGLAVSDMTADQRELMEKVMHDVLAPFRSGDREESMKLIKANGFENLHLSFYKNMDVGDDKVWDVWQVEGPAMVWYFRGDPHVHTWVHIRETA
ncbi:MAG: DUF3500 domain-containing protein [Planctomycetales bacterium]|nr:DUF3500 domain-containing protein [Planctomycetales bacterium]